MKIEPVPEIDRFGIRAFTRSYVVYHLPPGQEQFEDVITEHLQGKGYASQKEIPECQMLPWEMLKLGK